MRSRKVFRCTLAICALLALAARVQAQEDPAKRLANIVAVAVSEYTKGVDDRGRLTSAQEYQETLDFIADAEGVANRIAGKQATAARAVLDTLMAAVRAKAPPAQVRDIHSRFVDALGEAGALDLPTRPLNVAEGRAVYEANCASCHGARGLGDGPAAKGLNPAPPAIGGEALADVSPELVYRVISAGVSGTSMPAWGGTLTPQQRWNVVSYLQSLGTSPARADTGSAAASRAVLVALDQALAAGRTGRPSDANDRAFDAYIAFEPLETTARAKSPGLVAAMERRFADFKAQIKTNDLREAQKTRDAIEAGLPSVVELSQRASGAWEAFLQSFLIILREGFEAILVIGAIVAFLIKTGNRDRLRAIWIGAGLGIGASALTAVVLQTVLRAVPASRDLIEGISMLVAVVVLFWVSYWLISKVEAAKWQQFIRQKVATALAAGGGSALAFVAFLAVYREGAETALFYQALFGEGAHLLVPLALGIGCGAAALAVIFTLFYKYGVKIPLRPFFAITSALLYYMAFVFMGRGIRELQEVNVVPITVLHGFPTLDAMGIYATLETAGAQLLLVLLFVIALAKTFWPRRAPVSPGARDGKGAGDAASSPTGARIRRTGRRSRGAVTRDR